MPYKLEGTWQPADYAPDETNFLRSYQKRRNFKSWLSSRSPEDTERYRLEKKQEDREMTESDIAWSENEANMKSNREKRIRNRERARENIEEKRVTLWDKEGKVLDEEIRFWIREEEREKEQEVENEKQWNRKLRSGTRFHRATSSEKIQANMKLEQEAERKANEKEGTRRKEERIAKFEAMVKAEADRWTEELDLANAAARYPYDETFEGRIGLVHRYG
ncbi:hypothetical protein BOTCAL_0087g00290 [Botryotinia calthae]|uniref:Uncharacterized protein n=1 Tax=Botryotinia calthae TaxID=38488 RepID=A0A4Y8D9X1_9HELO|nr:hypothetical protein BOTCAL_0087g00290 [Botryotinia calthae]